MHFSHRRENELSKLLSACLITVAVLLATQCQSSIYSGTSLKELSELRTHAVQKNLPINRFCSPNGTMLIPFYLYITAKMTQKWLVPKCPL